MAYVKYPTRYRVAGFLFVGLATLVCSWITVVLVRHAVEEDDRSYIGFAFFASLPAIAGAVTLIAGLVLSIRRRNDDDVVAAELPLPKVITAANARFVAWIYGVGAAIEAVRATLTTVRSGVPDAALRWVLAALFASITAVALRRARRSTRTRTWRPDRAGKP